MPPHLRSSSFGVLCLSLSFLDNVSLPPPLALLPCIVSQLLEASTLTLVLCSSLDLPLVLCSSLCSSDLHLCCAALCARVTYICAVQLSVLEQNLEKAEQGEDELEIEVRYWVHTRWLSSSLAGSHSHSLALIFTHWLSFSLAGSHSHSLALILTH